ncbi:MAG: type II toxin-antitoxin system VapC family toxin [Deltaproteobacteria bacterium]|nr:type II toxin-antitoxin system VapC family toxin [Deltaproteobacteria bacterium]
MREDDKRIYFFDTSALVKRYHQETGTDIVDAAFGDREAAKIISDIGVIEFYSAFAKKARMGEITEEDFRETIRGLAQDIRSGTIELTPLSDSDKKEAVTLIEKHGLSKNLRTLDAMQLAVMKRFGSQIITRVYCADRLFVASIEEEGFTVTNPEAQLLVNR